MSAHIRNVGDSASWECGWLPGGAGRREWGRSTERLPTFRVGWPLELTVIPRSGHRRLSVVRLMHVTKRINTGSHGALRVEKGELDGANQEGFQAGFPEEVMMSCDQGF